MAFGIGINTEKPNAGKIRGRQESVAVDCWFTSQGETIPRMLKYQDEEGEIRVMKDIQVIAKKEKNYSGIPTMEYECRIRHNDQTQELKLIFFLEEHRWTMIL